MEFFLVLTCLSAGSRSLSPPLKCSPKIRACKLPSPYIFIAIALLKSLPNHFSPTYHEKTLVVLSLLPVVLGRNILFGSLCTCTQYFGLIRFSNHLNYYECLSFLIRRLLSALSIYLFTFNFLWAVQLRYNSAFPWNIPLCTFESAKLFPPAVSSTLHIFMAFSIKFMTSFP